jgi:hypothetical protein
MDVGLPVALVWLLVWLPGVVSLLVNPIYCLLYQILFLGVWLPPLLSGWVPLLTLESHGLDNILLILQLTPL